MAGILGIYASSVLKVTNSYKSIDTKIVGVGGIASITFTSIPSTYKNLQIRLLGKSNRVDANEAIGIQFNGDTGNNYGTHGIWGDGASAATAQLNYPSSAISLPWVAGSLSTNAWGVGILDILDYTSTNKNKTVRGLQGYDNNGSGQAGFGSGLWTNTSAITSITIKPFYGTLWNQYSHFALYGIEG